MKSDESFVPKSYDSKAEKGTARGQMPKSRVLNSVTEYYFPVCPYAEFENPLTPYGARLRESIECLVYVVYPEDNGKGVDEEFEVTYSS